MLTSQMYYEQLNGFLSQEELPEELKAVPDLFTSGSFCDRKLKEIYQTRSKLIDQGISERDLDTIFDGFEELMREVSLAMYGLGASLVLPHSA